MIEVDIPDFGRLRLAHAVFDVNGTLAVDGQPDPVVVRERQELASCIQVHLVSALTHSNQADLEAVFGIPIHRVAPGHEAEQKAQYLRELGAKQCVAIGNGRNDVLMLEAAALAIVVMGAEGAAVRAVQAADILVASPHDAIGLLLHPQRLRATLRS